MRAVAVVRTSAWMPRACDNKANALPHADGRMPPVDMYYNARSEHDSQRLPPHQVRYLAGFYGLDQLGLQLRRQAAHVGWDDAEQQIALSDGGAGLEEFFCQNFPLAG